MPLVSYSYASGNRKRMKDSILFAMKAMLLFITAISVVYFFGSAALTEAFMKNEAIVSYGSAFLRGFCLSLPFLCIDFLAVSVFQAIGKGKSALLFAILRKIILEIPALILLNRLFPLYGLAYAQFTAEVALSAAAVWSLWRIFKQKNAPRSS